MRRSVLRLSLAASAAFVIAACSDAENTAPGTVTSASVALTDDKSTRRVTWMTDPAGTPVTLEVAGQPDAPAGARTLLGENLTATHFLYDAAPLTRRAYFMITPERGDTMTTALRVLPLEGGRNFRDLGGYSVESGQTVKWGKVFRSGVMANLTDSDYKYLSSIGIRVVCDFRSNEEREVEPTNWRAGVIEYLTTDYTTRDAQGEFFKVMSDPDLTADKTRQLMTDLTSMIPYQYTAQYRIMFDRLAAGDIPLTFNCSAGKDRTGVAAALLLTALGVPRETVIEDYALTEKLINVEELLGSMRGDSEGSAADAGDQDEGPYAFLQKLPPEVLMPLLRSDPVYIRAMFKTLETKHGSTMAFIQDELQVTDEELAQIRSHLLD